MIVEMTLSDALYVTENARPSDVASWSPFYFDKSAEALALSRYQGQGIKRALVAANGRPLAIGGFQLSHPLTWTAWFVAVEGWQSHAREVLRFCRDTVSSMFEKGVARRVQAWVIVGDERALRFAQAVGLEVEALVKSLGEGVDFYQLRRIA